MNPVEGVTPNPAEAASCSETDPVRLAVCRPLAPEVVRERTRGTGVAPVPRVNDPWTLEAVAVPFNTPSALPVRACDSVSTNDGFPKVPPTERGLRGFSSRPSQPRPVTLER